MVNLQPDKFGDGSIWVQFGSDKYGLYFVGSWGIYNINHAESPKNYRTNSLSGDQSLKFIKKREEVCILIKKYHHLSNKVIDFQQLLLSTLTSLNELLPYFYFNNKQKFTSKDLKIMYKKLFEFNKSYRKLGISFLVISFFISLLTECGTYRMECRLLL